MLNGIVIVAMQATVRLRCVVNVRRETMKTIAEIVKTTMLEVQAKAHESGHLDEREQVCFGCGEIVYGEEDGDHPCDCYSCTCGRSWLDEEGYENRKQSWADMERKSIQERGEQ
jgi:hypothetical protein